MTPLPEKLETERSEFEQLVWAVICSGAAAAFDLSYPEALEFVRRAGENDNQKLTIVTNTAARRLGNGAEEKTAL